MARVRGDRRIAVNVKAVIDGGDTIEENKDAVIPADYDSADVRALTARVVEDTAFALLKRVFNRVPSRDALIALAARLRGISLVLDDPISDADELRRRVRAILALDNLEATEQWGDDPEGS